MHTTSSLVPDLQYGVCTSSYQLSVYWGFLASHSVQMHQNVSFPKWTFSYLSISEKWESNKFSFLIFIYDSVFVCPIWIYLEPVAQYWLGGILKMLRIFRYISPLYLLILDSNKPVYTCNSWSVFLFISQLTTTYKSKVHMKILACLAVFCVIFINKFILLLLFCVLILIFVTLLSYRILNFNGFIYWSFDHLIWET